MADKQLIVHNRSLLCLEDDYTTRMFLYLLEQAKASQPSDNHTSEQGSCTILPSYDQLLKLTANYVKVELDTDVLLNQDVVVIRFTPPSQPKPRISITDEQREAVMEEIRDKLRQPPTDEDVAAIIADLRKNFDTVIKRIEEAGARRREELAQLLNAAQVNTGD